jgi:disulfide bond formation protein DsbB
MNKLMKIGLVLLIVGIAVGVGAILYLFSSISSSVHTVTIQPNGTYVFTLHEGQFGGFIYNSTSPISYKVSGNAAVNTTTRNGLNTVSIVPQSPTVNITLYNPSNTVAEVRLFEQGFQIFGVLAIALLGFAVFVVGAILALVGFIRGRRRGQ